jgi:DNA-directed RNA polymerase sigma subunit (sigma70/sigma32)
MTLTRVQEAAAAEMEVEGKSYREIGRVLGCTDKAAKAAAERGRVLDPVTLEEEEGLRLLFSRRYRRLEARDVQLMAMRLGMRGHKRHTLEQVGTALGISRQRVAQLEKRAITALNSTP